MSLSKVFTDYRQWIYVNSKLVSQTETILKFMSYVIAGKMKSSAISEFLYSTINIIVLINDEILVSTMKLAETKQRPEMIFTDQQWRPIRIFFTVIDNLSVFLELYTTKCWGVQGKWMVITILQVLKFLWRSLILIRYGLGLDHCRPLSPLNRKQISPSIAKPYLCLDENEMSVAHQQSFTLKTGRIIRTVEGSPDFLKRNWKPPSIDKENNNKCSSKLEGISCLGEGIHITKPLVHLYLMKRYGQRSFIPFVCALAMDLSSLKLIQTDNLGSNKEIQRRQVMLLMYLMRSPFYDHFSRNFLDTVLSNLGKLPIVGYVPKHILQYIPYWQQLYSYIWD